MKVVKGIETVGHLPREFSRIAWYFLARSGEISVEVMGRRQHNAGLKIATHWSPMRPKIEHWRLTFQNWSPAGDSHFV